VKISLSFFQIFSTFLYFLQAEERKLELAEQYLEEDASMFDEFLKDNDKNAVEAIKVWDIWNNYGIIALYFLYLSTAFIHHCNDQRFEVTFFRILPLILFCLPTTEFSYNESVNDL